MMLWVVKCDGGGDWWNDVLAVGVSKREMGTGGGELCLKITNSLNSDIVACSPSLDQSTNQPINQSKGASPQSRLHQQRRGVEQQQRGQGKGR